MERQGFEIPLLIGGATTSRAHTAVKVAQKYHGPVIWVKDASRSVPVVADLLSDERRPELLAETAAEYQTLRERHAAPHRQPRRCCPLARRRDWTAAPSLDLRARLPAPLARCPCPHVRRSSPTTRSRSCARYIDWQPFFSAWEMRGRFPDILNNPATGEAARRLYEDAQPMLDTIIAERWLRASGVFGLFPANAVDGDDIEVYTDETRRRSARPCTSCGSRPRAATGRRASRWPTSWRRQRAARPRRRDYVGRLAVTAGWARPVAAFKKANDDYSAIMLEALADRLAEAFAERLHERVRTEFWGYAADEPMSNEALIAEKYSGIRPAPGYPACPEHTEKQTIWELLDVEASAGIELTESMAMWPGAAVSGLYFAHPEARYFNLGRVGRDQVEDYARRKGWTVAEAERWLSPNLGYRTEDE